MAYRGSWGIGTLLVAVMVAASALSLSIVGPRSASSARDLAVSGGLREAQRAADSLAAEIEQFLSFHVRAAAAVASQAAPGPLSTPYLSAALARCRESYPDFAALAVADATGKLLVIDPPGPSGQGRSRVGLADERWLTRALQASGPLVDDRAPLGSSGAPIVRLGVPIRDASGQVRGAVVGELALDGVQSIADRIRLGETGRAQLASADGIVLTHRDRSPLERGDDASGTFLWRHLAGAAGGVLRDSTTTPAEPGLVGYATVGGLGWKVWVTQSLAEIDREIVGAYGWTVGWALLALGAVAATALALATVVTRPLRALERSVRSLGTGDYARCAVESGPREVVDLARAVNQVAGSVARHEHETASAGSLLTGMLESVTEYAIIAAGLDGVTVTWNEGAHRLYGFAAADVIGRGFATFESEDVASGRVAELFNAARVRGKWEGEMRQIRADGSRFTAHLTITLRRSVAGEPIGFTTIARDLTAQQRIERDLRRSELRFRQLLEAAPDAIVIVDAEGRIVLVNAQAEKTFRYRRGQMLNKPVEMLIPDRMQSGHTGHRASYLASPRARPMGPGLDLWGRRSDRTEFPVEVSLSPMETEAGTLISSAIRDITEQRALREQLREKNEELEKQYARVQEASRLKSEFLANMSHELRTPLNGIIGFAELMHDGKVGPVSDDHKEYLGDILTSSRHLLRLINDLLDLAKVESGKMEFRPEILDLASVIGEVCDSVRTLVVQKQIELGTTIDPAAAVAVTDAGKLKQILYNYISNALKFTPQGGRVGIRVTADEPQHFRLEVEDTGIGIPAEDLSKLFNEFQQLGAGTAQGRQGTGLGLALTRRIAEAQGGRVEVRSTPGVGSVFSAVLPRVSRTVPVGLAPPETLDAVDREPVILVVDDDLASLKLADRALQSLGYRVVGCPGTQPALRAAAEESPAAVVMDLRMPWPDGFELLRRVRETRTMHRTPVVVWTVKELTQAEREHLAAFADAVVRKDDGIAALTEALQRYVPAPAFAEKASRGR
jgi:PAS domain S-box-containing protein